MNKGIRSYPVNERPYERCEEYGPEALSDAELLAVILRTGSRKKDVKSLALDVLESVGGSISGLASATLSELTELPGIGRVKAIQLICVAQIAKRMWKQDIVSADRIFHAKDAAAYYMQDLRYMDTEHVYSLMLDIKMKLLGDYHASNGSVRASIVPVREIVREALKHNAVNIILVHNHPSGDPTPSVSDRETYHNLEIACRISGLTLVDSIIIGDGNYFSFAEEGRQT